MVKHRKMAVAIDQTIERFPGEFPHDPRLQTGQSAPAMNQADPFPAKLNHPLIRQTRRIEVAAHGIDRLGGKEREKLRIDQIPGMQDHLCLCKVTTAQLGQVRRAALVKRGVGIGKDADENRLNPLCCIRCKKFGYFYPLREELSTMEELRSRIIVLAPEDPGTGQKLPVDRYALLAYNFQTQSTSRNGTDMKKDDFRIREAWVLCFILGIIMLNFPFLQIFNKTVRFFEIPLLLLYFFIGWPISIFVVYLFTLSIVPNGNGNNHHKERR